MMKIRGLIDAFKKFRAQKQTPAVVKQKSTVVKQKQTLLKIIDRGPCDASANAGNLISVAKTPGELRQNQLGWTRRLGRSIRSWWGSGDLDNNNDDSQGGSSDTIS